METRKQH